MEKNEDTLFKLCKLWGFVKFFHPYLANREIDWDSALFSAIAQIQSDGPTSSLEHATTTLLSFLEDPATRIQSETLFTKSTLETKHPDAKQIKKDILLVEMTNYADFSDWVKVHERAVLVAEEIAKHDFVIFDLRRKVNCQLGSTPDLAFEGTISAALCNTAMQAPSQRTLQYIGYPPENGGCGSSVHRSGFVIRDGMFYASSGNRTPKNTVFIVEPESNVPPIALALQNVGNAFIVAEGGWDDRNLIALHSIDLGEGKKAQVRLSELLYRDGTTGVAPDVTVPKVAFAGSDAAMDAAIDLVQNPRSRSRTRGLLPPVRTRYVEQDYAETDYPPVEQRLLALFKIHNVIEYFFPYKDLMDGNWDEQLRHFLPRIVGAANALEYAKTVAELLTHLQDSHVALRSSVLNHHIGNGHLPIRVRWCEDSVVIQKICDPEVERVLELKTGDVILRIDGEDAVERVNRVGKYISASTKQAWYRNAVARSLRGPVDSIATLTIRDAAGVEKNVAIQRNSTSSLPRNSAPRDGAIFKWLSAEVGYADLDRLTSDQVNEMFEVFASAKAIIFDNRGYPNGTCYKIAAKLTSCNKTLATLIEQLRVSAPLEGEDCISQPSLETFWETVPPPNGTRFEGLTVMLIDEGSQSHSEHTGLFLKAANGTALIGSPTAGANGDITSFVLPGRMLAIFTGLSVRHPDGRQLQRIGLLPDIEVTPTIQGLQAGRDEVLDAAMKYIQCSVHE